MKDKGNVINSSKLNTHNRFTHNQSLNLRSIAKHTIDYTLTLPLPSFTRVALALTYKHNL